MGTSRTSASSCRIAGASSAPRLPAAFATTSSSAASRTARCRRAAGTLRSSSLASASRTGRTSRRGSGVAYDLFGDGRTALKGNISRYVAAESVATAAANNPQDTIGRTDTRNWHDLNGDYTIYNPDGSLQAIELGPTTNQNFGKVVPSNDDARSGDAQRIQCARIDGGMAGGDAASGHAAHCGQRRVLLPLERQPDRHRQHAHHQRRFRWPVLHRCAVASGSAGRRRLSGLRSVRHQAAKREAFSRTTSPSPATSGTESSTTFRASTSARRCASAIARSSMPAWMRTVV